MRTWHAPFKLRLPELEEGEEDSAHDSCLRHTRTHAGEQPAHSLLLDSLLEHLAAHMGCYAQVFSTDLAMPVMALKWNADIRDPERDSNLSVVNYSPTGQFKPVFWACDQTRNRESTQR